MPTTAIDTAAGPDTAGSGGITITDPRTGEVLWTVPEAAPEAVNHAVEVARRATPEWAATAPEDRGAALKAAARALDTAAQELAGLNASETGRPVEEALAGIGAAVSTLEQYAELAPVHRGHSLRGNRLAADYTVAEPRGVAVLLTPWNDPVAVACGLIGAALATGNTVIHKPSERCPRLGEALGEVLAPAFPPGVFLTVSGGAGVGALLSQSEVDVLAHVGSSASGARIARAGALTGAHVIRENGGNDPLLVDRDVDPAWAAEQAAIGSFSNSGQICTAVERIYVHRDIAEDFTAALRAEAARRNADGSVAPLVDTRMRDAVHAQVSEALAAGAAAVEGGELPAGPGSFYPATVLVGCTARMQVMTEETFGPVAPVQVVDTFDDGLRLACSGKYGLAATVLSSNIAHIQQAVAALPVGTVKVNAVFGGAPGGAAQPRGDSGAGFGYGPELLDEFSQVKVVHIAAPPAPPAGQGRP
ncbi:Aldehyde Dehydrogenase [Pseudarthrobacter chlorophenolicus A6]|uniref:Aldehyde Dehydrogenase n=1 Tax=Pseudarthrobacter chlorophenolicus (strain ATCC 700700 / DSM 12829 / CIP 107037 / JCM 12360 / KCTC 9906 / NCIMB 13794 / A6) TaxID=452863 RepID=B8HB87_PSECP|nr:aldehyde dehydrogenase [Pseudarthrobacter chlorophenolicus]ACL38572.1 Aldehyde Dehydrogenase [Pseudarthrobacter chlorophenolicus A6]SDQ46030.1 Acyl-CoA reductase [Pseudarthrobacter chlorophenolicus]